MPFSVLPPTAYLSLSIIVACARIPCLLEISCLINVSPKVKTVPTSEFAAPITELKFPIEATVTVPYSLVHEFHAEPELSDRKALLPFNNGRFLQEISRHSSRASLMAAALLTLAFSMAFIADIYLNGNCLPCSTPLLSSSKIFIVLS